MKKIGRKTKLTPEVQERICTSVRLGNTYECAAEAGGIAKPTLFDWINRGMDGEEPFSDFYNTIKKARAEAEEYAVDIIRNAMLTTWTAAAWWLERTNYKGWGRKTGMEISQTIRHEIRELSDEELIRIIKDGAGIITESAEP